MNKDNKDTEEEFEVAVGTDGKWGWFVVFNSFICNLLVDGMQYTFSNFLQPISIAFHVAVPQVSLIGSLLSGFYNFSGPIASGLGNKFGFRMVIITGSLVSSGGLMLSYFAMNVPYLYFFYGVLTGLGFGMIYMASVIMTSLYFEKYRALASSLSVCGTGVGTFIFSPMGSYLVETVGWRLALVIEGAVLLLCILCGLSFKPLKMIRVVPLSRRPSVTSVTSDVTTFRGSLFYSAEHKKTLRNEMYPTFKEALQIQGDDDRRGTIGSLVMISRFDSIQGSVGNIYHQAPIFSLPTSTLNINRPPPRTCREKCKRKCDICCFNFWHCQCKQKDLTLGDRPMYRDDIFYGGSLTTLNKYSSSERINYHLSVTRVPDAAEVEQHASRKCCVCHQAVLRTCLTMTGFNLLSSRVFVFLCISSFMYTLSLYIPYVYIRMAQLFPEVADDYKISEEISLWLVSAIGISNTTGRLASGIIKSFAKVNAAGFALTCLTVSGIVSFIFFITVNVVTLFVFSCAFGLFTAPFISLRPVIIVDFLGLEKLTNAFGLVLLCQGIASIAGPPLAGVVQEKLGKSVYVIYLSGGFLLTSSVALLISTLLNRKIKKTQST